MKTYNIATLPADGIGPEVIEAGVAVLQALAARDGGFALISRRSTGGRPFTASMAR